MSLKVTKDTFQAEVLQADKPVLVDFYADWCTPCKMLGPVIEEIAEENPQIKVCKVNIDEEADLAQEFHVMSIPNIVVFKEGNISASTVGVRSKDELLALLDK
ncbi:MAG: thioredoxin [Oscillospiraceae bacterium]|jgi:thioredoxin 1|nr:thioredoxin [Oscillospiraceae bacterium]